MTIQEYTMRVYYEVLGGHTHMSIWTGRYGCSLGKCGDIIMTNEEFQAWRRANEDYEILAADGKSTMPVEFLEKGSTPPHQRFRAGAGPAR